MDNKVAVKSAPGRCSRYADVASLYSRDGARKYLNRDERSRAIEAMNGLAPDKRLFALTLAWTGARVSEVLALTPASFQIEAGIVAVATLKRRRFCVRELPLPGPLVREIDRHYGLGAAQRDPARAAARLWPWHRVTAWRFVKSVGLQTGAGRRASCPRGFRHGFGVGALQAGVPLNLVQRWLGHASIATTAIYADACGPEEVEFARRLWRDS
jgi:integrase/recombinase XerD